MRRECASSSLVRGRLRRGAPHRPRMRPRAGPPRRSSRHLTALRLPARVSAPAEASSPLSRHSTRRDVGASRALGAEIATVGSGGGSARSARGRATRAASAHPAAPSRTACAFSGCESRAQRPRPLKVQVWFNDSPMATMVEQLGDDKVKVTVEVPANDVHHAVEHAANDLAASVRIPGFRKGKVPMPILLQRVGKERIYSEAVESHIGGWFWNAATRARVNPVAQPEFDY